MVIDNRYLQTINKVTGTQTVPASQKSIQSLSEFNKVLQQEIDRNSGLKFSKHAELRMQSRDITLTQTQKDKITQALKRAEQKGVKDSLVLMDDIAFVVNVKSRTVITAVNSSELQDNVFTNIDGAIFA